jgi:hypothetical protein
MPARRRVETGDRRVAEKNASLRARQVAGQKLHQCGLADAVAAEHAQDFAGGGATAEIAHDGGRAVAAAEIVEGETRCAHFPLPT